MANAPAKKFSIGYITATIWENEKPNGKGTWYSIEITRTYKQDDDLKNTTSFSAADMLNVAKVAERAEHWVAQQ